jgi:signal transduction histidine kinase
VAIRDTGKSIRASAKDRVFDPYYQSRSGNRNAGFALALVYQFVALSGGSIEAQSTPGGAEYLLTFPAADGSLNPPEIEPSAVPALVIV